MSYQDYKDGYQTAVFGGSLNTMNHEHWCKGNIHRNRGADLLTVSQFNRWCVEKGKQALIAPSQPHDNVSHPKHYTSHPSGVECIEVTRHMGFNLGNAVKYIWRADLKEKKLEDLKKAKWYIEDEIKRLEK